jgi:hypothetical protein
MSWQKSIIEAELPPEIYAAALARGQELELDGIVEDLLRPKSGN